MIFPGHLAILSEILPTLPKTAPLSRIVLDASAIFTEEDDVEKAEWSSLDTIVSEYAERISAKDSNQRLVLQFRTEVGGALGEPDRWVRDHVSSLASFPNVGRVEYVSKR